MVERRRSQSTLRIDTAELGLTASPTERVGHFLVPASAPGDAREVATAWIVIGRSEDSDLRIEDPGISMAHCRARLEGNEVLVEDLGSTNGTHVEGRRIPAPTAVPVGAMIRIGRTELRHEVARRSELEAQAALSDDLETAARHVEGLVPEPLVAGPVRVYRRLVPSRRLGGDILGYRVLPSGETTFHVVDVSGHGLRAAMHSVSVQNAIRGASESGIAPTDPAGMLNHLRRLFRMEDHGGMYFTLWYGVLDAAQRTISYASAGHPPAMLLDVAGDRCLRLRTPQPPVGMLDDFDYEAEAVPVSPGALLYVFSDGVYEEAGPDGRPLGLDWLERVVRERGTDPASEPGRIEAALRAGIGGRRLEDDFSVLVVALP